MKLGPSCGDGALQVSKIIRKSQYVANNYVAGHWSYYLPVREKLSLELNFPILIISGVTVEMFWNNFVNDVMTSLSSGGGLVVSVLAFLSGDPGLNPAFAERKDRDKKKPRLAYLMKF